MKNFATKEKLITSILISIFSRKFKDLIIFSDIQKYKSFKSSIETPNLTLSAMTASKINSSPDCLSSMIRTKKHELRN